MSAPHISPFSGSWYPNNKAELNSLLDELFVNSSRRCPFPFPGGFGFVVPHAGPAYSGTVAAAAYRALERLRPERVVLLAFPHHGGLRGLASPDVRAIATPLGEVEIDSGYAGVPVVPEAGVCDHSFEIQLPFLQRAAPQARISPIYVGPMNAGERGAAARTLAEHWRPGVAFVASSDFTHYGRSFGFSPFPPDEDAAGNLRNLDFECIEAAATLDPEQFLGALRDTGATVCGVGPIALLLEVLRRLDAPMYQTTLDYQTSGEITGDFRHSVSYAALGCFPRTAFDLDECDREALLDGAAAAIERLRRTGERRPIAASGGSDALKAPRSAFVSLHRGDELLGCIGRCEAQSPLAAAVPSLALAAALDDPRFRPAAGSPGSIDIEISVLTPFRRIRREEECQVGTHGVFLKLGGRAGLLLPQVAAERGWSTRQFLEALVRKAMLGPHAWRDPKAKLYVFEAQVFSRKQALT